LKWKIIKTENDGHFYKDNFFLKKNVRKNDSTALYNKKRVMIFFKKNVQLRRFFVSYISGKKGE